MSYRNHPWYVSSIWDWFEGGGGGKVNIIIKDVKRKSSSFVSMYSDILKKKLNIMKTFEVNKIKSYNLI